MLHWLAAFILLWMFIKIFITRQWLREPYQKHFILLAAVCLTAYHVLIFSWWYPNSYTDSIAVRFFLIFAILCAISPILLFAFCPSWNRRWAKPLFVFGLCSFLLHHPLAAQGQFIRGHLYCQEADRIRDFLKQYGTDRILVFMTAPPRIMDLDCLATDFRSANKNAEYYLRQLNNHAYRDIIVIQRWWYGSSSNPPSTKDSLDPAYNLQTLSEYQISSTIFIKILKVIPSKDGSRSTQVPQNLKNLKEKRSAIF